jgi:nucleotide-binding universal stress UspA family protein
VGGVVVGLNRAGRYDPVIRWASAEAALHGLPLTLVHAWDAPVGVSVELDAGALPGLSGPVTSCAVPGAPDRVLLDRDPDLLVLACSDESHRVDRNCVRRARCPVVLMSTVERRETGRVVVGICGTDASRAAFAWAVAEAKRRRADLVVVHAWQLHPSSARELVLPSRALPVHQQSADDELRTWVDSMGGPTGVELRARHGGPLDQLLDAGADADLIVVGRHAHGPVGQFIHGALGDDLARLARCPVVLVPTPARDVDTPRTP